MPTNRFKKYYTKDNKLISFSYELDASDNLSDAWILHKLTAYVDNNRAGYLKISYIPANKMKKYYPTIVQYLTLQGKLHITSLSSRNIDFVLSDISKLVDPHPKWLANTHEHLKWPHEKKEEVLQNYVKILNDKYGEEYIDFKNMYTDNPYVDFINVSEDHRRNHVSIALYEEGTRWMNSLGMRLYASSLQSNEAKAVWQYLSKIFTLKYDTFKWYNKIIKRTYIDL